MGQRRERQACSWGRIIETDPRYAEAAQRFEPFASGRVDQER